MTEEIKPPVEIEIEIETEIYDLKVRATVGYSKRRPDASTSTHEIYFFPVKNRIWIQFTYWCNGNRFSGYGYEVEEQDITKVEEMVRKKIKYIDMHLKNQMTETISGLLYELDAKTLEDEPNRIETFKDWSKSWWERQERLRRTRLKIQDGRKGKRSRITDEQCREFAKRAVELYPIWTAAKELYKNISATKKWYLMIKTEYPMLLNELIDQLPYGDSDPSKLTLEQAAQESGIVASDRTLWNLLKRGGVSSLQDKPKD